MAGPTAFLSGFDPVITFSVDPNAPQPQRLDETVTLTDNVLCRENLAA